MSSSITEKRKPGSIAGPHKHNTFSRKMGVDTKLGLLVCLSLLLNGGFLVHMLLNHSELVSRDSLYLSRLSHDASGVDNWKHSDDDYHYEPGTILQDVHPSELDTCVVNDSSHTRKLDNFMNTLQTVIPPPSQFLEKFQNPCWHMSLSLSRKIKRMFMHKGGSLTDAEAAYIMSEMFHPDIRTGGKVTKSLFCIPKVFFIGFPRSGSTQLYQMLTRHPQLIGGANKEPHWWTRFPFTTKFPHNILAIIRYLIHYQEASEHVAEHHDSLLIDGSQSTVWDTRRNLCILPSLISRVVPSAKYIVLMRDPVSRLYSDFTYLCTNYMKANRMQASPQYAMQSPDTFHIAAEQKVHQFQKCLETLPLDTCTHYALESKSNESDTGCGRVRLGVSLYYVHLAKWLRTIPQEKFLFLRTDDLAKDPYAILKRIWKFLELPSQPSIELHDILYNHTHSNPLSQTRMKPQTQQMLENFFVTYNKKLAELLQDDRFLWQDTSA